MRVLWVIVIVVAGAVAGYLFTRFEGDAPVIQTRTVETYVGNEHTQDVRVTDEGTGVQSLRVWIESGDDEFVLVDETYPGGLLTGADSNVERFVEVTIKPAELGLPDGPATLLVDARDFSWGGNEKVVEVPLIVDVTPPRISVLTGLTYVRRGGAELVSYQIDEETRSDGVQLGDVFSPGFEHPAFPERRIAFYALPPDAGPGDKPMIVAEDLAGNRSAVPVTIEIIERSFPQDSIALSESFMAQKAAELGVSTDDGVLAAYLSINGDMRRDNAARIREICSSSSGEQLWSGPFLQLPNSHVGARFADRRTYYFEGEPVDSQVHLGYDLASTTRAEVPAANDGVVVFSGNLGIYGNTIIIDHGLGLFSLYGHLSDSSVEKGRAVAKGETIGHTGQTGLAGGDHLHFSMLVNGVFVDPIEWFDERWIREHIEPKLAAPPTA